MVRVAAKAAVLADGRRPRWALTRRGLVGVQRNARGKAPAPASSHPAAAPPPPILPRPRHLPSCRGQGRLQRQVQHCGMIGRLKQHGLVA